MARQMMKTIQKTTVGRRPARGEVDADDRDARTTRGTARSAGRTRPRRRSCRPGSAWPDRSAKGGNEVPARGHRPVPTGRRAGARPAPTCGRRPCGAAAVRARAPPRSSGSGWRHRWFGLTWGQVLGITVLPALAAGTRWPRPRGSLLPIRAGDSTGVEPLWRGILAPADPRPNAQVDGCLSGAPRHGSPRHRGSVLRWLSSACVRLWWERG